METVASLKDSYKVPLSDVIWSQSQLVIKEIEQKHVPTFATPHHTQCVSGPWRGYIHWVNSFSKTEVSTVVGAGPGVGVGSLTLEKKSATNIDTDAVFILSALFPGHTNSWFL